MLRVWWNKWYRKIVTRSRNLGILFIYHTNLWRYNSQKALDALLNGRPQQTAHVPFMITRKMRKSLASLGYSERDIDKMTPGEASNVINQCIKKSMSKPPTSESQEIERKKL
ncbi:hypothetical protein ACROYT_G004988 [Oculina patagonica]